MTLGWLPGYCVVAKATWDTQSLDAVWMMNTFKMNAPNEPFPGLKHKARVRVLL